MSAVTPARPTLADRTRREWYVVKVDFLAQDVPAGYRREHRRELRADLTAAASDVGMARAVRDLGPASTLAHQLTQAEGRRLPHVWTGVIAFAVALWSYVGMLVALAHGLGQAADQLRGTRSATVHAAWLGTTVTVTHGDTWELATQGSGWEVLAIVAVPLVAARAWRYRPAWWQRHRAHAAATATITSAQ